MKRGLTVRLPQLPHAEQPRLQEWRQYIEKECHFKIDEHTLFVGHSSGAILALIYSQNHTNKIGAVVDVSVFYNNSLQWEPNDILFDIPIDWKAVSQ